MNRIARVALAALFAAAVQGAAAQDLYRDTSVWLDDSSRPVHLDSLHGRPSILTMAYGACRRICSTSLRILEGVQGLADQQGIGVDFVVIGLAPSEDRPSDWAALRQGRNLTRSNWHFLTGNAAATRAMVQRLGIRVWQIDGHLMHDFKIVLLSPQGQVLKSMETFDQPLGLLLPESAGPR